MDKWRKTDGENPPAYIELAPLYTNQPPPPYDISESLQPSPSSETVQFLPSAGQRWPATGPDTVYFIRPPLPRQQNRRHQQQQQVVNSIDSCKPYMYTAALSRPLLYY